MLNNSVKKFIEKLAGPKVSIDFNDTLTTSRGKELAKRLIREGNDVYIVTRLNNNNRKVVEKVANEVGIKPNNIYFTNGAPKYETLRKLNITKHYDNNQRELDLIKKFTPFIKGIKF